MKINQNNLFLYFGLSLISIHWLHMFVTDGDFKKLPGIIITYGISLYILSYSNKSNTLLPICTDIKTEGPSNKILILGEELEETTNFDKLSKRYDTQMVAGKKLRRRVFILLLILASAIQINYGGVSSLCILNSITILLSTYIGHLLLPILFTIVYSAISIKWSMTSEFFSFYLAIFIVISLMFLNQYEKIIDTYKTNKLFNNKASKRPANWKSPFLFIAFFLVSTSVFQFIIPQYSNDKADVKKSKIRKQFQRANQLLGKLKSDLKFKNDSKDWDNISKKMQKANLDKFTRKQKASLLNNLKDNFDNSGIQELQERISHTTQNIHDIQSSLEMSSTKQEQQSLLKDLEMELSNQKINLKELDNELNKSLEENLNSLEPQMIQNALGKTSENGHDEIKAKRSSGNIHKILKEHSQQMSILKNKFKVPNRKSDSSNIGKNIEKHKKTITKNAKTLEKEENLVAPLIPQNKLDKIFIFLKYLFYILLVSGIFFYLRRFFTKSKERNYSEESIDIKQLKILQSEYRKIMKKKLTPKIEIIQLYNYIKSVIKEYHYTQGEVPPPNILLKEYDVLSEIKGLNQMTTVFCHCFYGNGDLSKSEHRLFRKNSKKMLRHYSIL